MNPQFIALFASVITCSLIILLSKRGMHIFGDSNYSGPQKIHTINTVRIGGIGIYLGIILGGIYVTRYEDNNNFTANFIIYSAPTIIIGTLEDCLKDISIKLRILFMVFSAIASIVWMNNIIQTTGIKFIDEILTIKILSYIFTIFCVVGLINSYNIIDGLNGLASISGLVALAGLYYVGDYYGNFSYSQNILIFIYSIFGFLIFNYPNAKIFLGDSGAYLIGLIIAVNSIYLVNSVESISPFFAILLNAYPIIETIFTIFRRKFISKNHISGADDKHLHTILYKRLLIKMKGVSTAKINGRTSSILWIMPTTACFLAIIFRESTAYLLISLFFYIAIYIKFYVHLEGYGK